MKRMINFDKLPTDLPNQYPLIDKGRYKAKVAKAEMKQPKNENKSPYLSVTWDVMNESGKSLGKVFDIFTESDNEYAQYKLKKFIEAIGIDLGGQFELRDLCKVATNKVCEIAVTIDDKNNPDQPRNQVNIFDKPPYKALEAYQNVTMPEDDGLPFSSKDAGGDSYY